MIKVKVEGEVQAVLEAAAVAQVHAVEVIEEAGVGVEVTVEAEQKEDVEAPAEAAIHPVQVPEVIVEVGR